MSSSLFTKPEVAAKVLAVLCLDHSNISPEEGKCLSSENVSKHSKFATVLDKKKL